MQDLVNQGRQKVIETSNAINSLQGEPLEDVISRIVSQPTIHTHTQREKEKEKEKECVMESIW